LLAASNYREPGLRATSRAGGPGSEPRRPGLTRAGSRAASALTAAAIGRVEYEQQPDERGVAAQDDGEGDADCEDDHVVGPGADRGRDFGGVLGVGQFTTHRSPVDNDLSRAEQDEVGGVEGRRQ